MSLSEAQGRQLRSLAALLREHPTERMLDHIADLMETLTAGEEGHAAEQEIPSAPSSRTRLSATERSRRRRATLKRSQLDLHGTDATRATGDATRLAVASVASLGAAPETAAVGRTSASQVKRCINVAPDSPSLSDLKISSKKERGAATSSDVVQRDATLPDDCRTAFDETCARKDVVLCSDFVWRKFARHAHDKRWKVHERLDRWVDWVEREIAWTSRAAERGSRGGTTNPGAVARARERDAALVAEREQAVRDFGKNRSEVLAAAAKAMELFA